ncbi:MFS transporter [Pandoraea pneumonica]|uniref:MFS transporter n=1 Tax=Pandoraea pneumonica TaxID=2508299 RepID=A0A5E4Z1U9_9BURK|nr:MFS transporter [Pandoraea pneumonica]VVE54555.1 MFS transporter [Pandoraea pneumonica]
MGKLQRIISTAAICQLGEGIHRTSVPIIAATIEVESSGVGLAVAASRLPWLLVSLMAGVAIDRLTAITVLRAGVTIRLIGLTMLLWVLTYGAIDLPLFTCVCFLIASGEVVTEISIQASIPLASHAKYLPNANARMYGIQIVFSQLLGPIAAGLLLATGMSTMVRSTVSLQLLAIFGAFVLCNLLVRHTPRARKINFHSEEGVRLQDVIRFLCKTRSILGIQILASLMMLIYGIWSAVFVLYATDANHGLGLTTFQYGLLMSAIAVGGLAGSITASRITKVVSEFSLVCFACIALVCLTAVCVLSRSTTLVCISLVAYGSSLATWNVAVVTHRQRMSPAFMLGRMTGIYRTCSWGMMPLGALIGAWVTSVQGTIAAFVLASILGLMQLPVIPLLSDMRRRRE